MMVLGSVAFGGWLGEQISTLTKEVPESWLPFYHVRNQTEGATCESEIGDSPDTDFDSALILDLLVSKTVRNKLLLFKTYPV